MKTSNFLAAACLAVGSAAACAAAVPVSAAPAVPAPELPAASPAAAPARKAAGFPAAPAGPSRNAGPRCTGELGAPSRLALQPGKSTLLRLPETVLNRSVGNPAVAQAMLVAPDTLYVAGVDFGGTNMIVQFKSGRCSVIDVDVSMDAAGLQASLAALMPHEKDIRVSAAADALVLSGTVEDGPAVAQVLELAQAHVRRAAPQPAALRGEGERAPAPKAESAPGQSARVINLLAVAAPQQVMLEVKIAEVSKTLLDKLEAGVMLHYAGGGWAATLLSNFLTGVARGRLDASRNSGASGGRRITIDAERQDGLVRILAEPTLMAVSGQEGSFLAGGKILIPVAQDDRRVTLEEKEFGVGLRFTPTVLSGGRINLKVAPEVSELSREGVGIQAGGIGGTAILPLVTTRRASTTVQLYDGQSFAIGGLIRNNQSSSGKRLPLLGDVPVLGALFRSTDFQHERTDLLFVITARLAKPLPPGQPLPTGDMTPPSRSELFLGGAKGEQP